MTTKQQTQDSEFMELEKYNAGGAGTIPITDWSLPKDLRKAILRYIKEAEDILSRTPNFINWKKEHTLDDITPGIFERSFFNPAFKTWTEALALYTLQGMKENIDDISKDPAYYYQLRSYLKKVRKMEVINTPETRGETRSFISEVASINKATKKNTAIVSKDLLELFTKPGESVFLGELSEAERKKIQGKQEKGKLLNSTTTGLPGGDAYFKKFCVALALTLSEQSQYYGTDEKLIGVPDKIISEIEPKINRNVDYGLVDKGGKKIPYYPPIILLNYIDFLVKLRGVNDASGIGGKDVQELKDYLDKMQLKEYLVRNNNGFTGIGLFYRTRQYTPQTEEIGSILILTPHFSKCINKFAKLRPDILKLLRGKSDDLTLSLFFVLVDAYNPLRKFFRPKRELLKKIAVAESYKAHPGRLANDFKKAVETMEKIKIILPGDEGYTEEGATETISIFTFNPGFVRGK